MMEVTLRVAFPHLMKIIHIQLNKSRVYLSDKGGIVAMFEVFGQHLFGEEELVEHEEAYAVVRPSHHILVALILHKEGWYIEKSVGLLEE